MSTNPTAEELFFKGLDCLDGNDFANAETYFVKTLELAKGRISALNNLAVAQYRQGKFSEAALTASEKCWHRISGIWPLTPCYRTAK